MLLPSFASATTPLNRMGLAKAVTNSPWLILGSDTGSSKIIIIVAQLATVATEGGWQ